MINFAANLNKMIDAGLGGPLDPPRTEVAVGHRVVYTEASGAVVNFETNVIAPIKKLRVTMEPIQAGSGDPSPENIRPITGRESVTVVRTGINVWDEEWEVGNLNGNGEPAIATDRIRSKNFCHCVPNTEYCFVIPNQNMRIYFYDADKTFLEYFGYWNLTRTFATPAKAYFFKILGSAAYGTTYNHDISINYPSTDHDYHAYNGQSATIQLGTTVYGGTVDVTTGTMTVTHVIVDLGNTNWVVPSDTTTPFRTQAVNTLPMFNGIIPKYNENFICTMYPSAGIKAYNNVPDGAIAFTNGTVDNPGSNMIRIHDSSKVGMTAAEFKAYISGTMLCYELLEPQTIQLTPEQMTTLKGQNNVWSDAGNISLEYPYYEETEGY